MVVNCHLGDQVDFEPVSNVTNVFYDDRNKQVSLANLCFYQNAYYT